MTSERRWQRKKGPAEAALLSGCLKRPQLVVSPSARPTEDWWNGSSPAPSECYGNTTLAERRWLQRGGQACREDHRLPLHGHHLHTALQQQSTEPPQGQAAASSRPLLVGGLRLQAETTTASQQRHPQGSGPVAPDTKEGQTNLLPHRPLLSHASKERNMSGSIFTLHLR